MTNSLTEFNCCIPIGNNRCQFSFFFPELKQDGLRLVLEGFRKRNRLICTLNSQVLQKYTLTSLMENSSFSLSELCASDVEADIRKALKCLHDNGIAHGKITTSSVIIDGVRY